MSRSDSLSKRGLYRSKNGVLLGVCKGVAGYFEFSVFWIRAAVVILFIFTGFWPVVGLYILAAFVMKSQPADGRRAGSKPNSGTRFHCARDDAAERLRRKWNHLEKRIRRMEDKISREFDGDNRFRG
jgi:phage shock protein C